MKPFAIRRMENGSAWDTAGGQDSNPKAQAAGEGNQLNASGDRDLENSAIEDTVPPAEFRRKHVRSIGIFTAQRNFQELFGCLEPEFHREFLSWIAEEFVARRPSAIDVDLLPSLTGEYCQATVLVKMFTITVKWGNLFSSKFEYPSFPVYCRTILLGDRNLENSRFSHINT